MDDLAAHTAGTIAFSGYVKGMRTNERDGELILTIAIPPAHKYAAMQCTDHFGTMFDFQADVHVRASEDFDPTVSIDGVPIIPAHEVGE